MWRQGNGRCTIVSCFMCVAGVRCAGEDKGGKYSTLGKASMGIWC
jgi:hypothetical protein